MSKIEKCKCAMTSKEKKAILLQFSLINDRLCELNKELDLWDFLPTKDIETGENIIKQIEKETDKLLKMRAKITDAINKIDDITEKRVLMLAYIGEPKQAHYERLKLWQIANKLHYSIDRIKQIHCKALEHIEIEKAD